MLNYQRVSFGWFPAKEPKAQVWPDENLGWEHGWKSVAQGRPVGPGEPVGGRKPWGKSNHGELKEEEVESFRGRNWKFKSRFSTAKSRPS